MDVQSTQVLVTRYIKQCPPPQELLFRSSTSLNMRQLARYVSMIPNVPDDSSFIGNTDMWATAEEFLKMLSGDAEEHAVLLCNLLTALDGVEAWVVLGEGTRPEPFNYTPMAVNSISSGSPHVRCTPMGRTCGEPDEIKKNTHPKYFTALFREQASRRGPRATC